MAAKLKIEKRGDEILIVHCCFSVSQSSSEAGTTDSYAAPEFTTDVFSGVRIAQSSVFCALSTTNYFILYLYNHLMDCYGSNILTL
jgi:hypothetical protein